MDYREDIEETREREYAYSFISVRYVYGDAFFTSSTVGADFTLQAEITLVTKDGNPTSSPSEWTRGMR